MSNDYVWDLETYPNVFTMAVEHVDYPITWAFEISPWRNDSIEIVTFVQHLKDTGSRMIGFNSLGFDYPILHMLMKMGNSDANTLYQKAQAIIFGQDDDDRWMHSVKPSDRYVEQIDLFKIHHFDNKARATGLKVLEFNMRSDNIEDLPFKVGTALTQDQLPKLKQYNAHDVSQTKKFYFKTLEMIRFREELTVKYGRDFMNHNDTKIGKDYFIMKLEEAGVSTYEYGPMGRTPKQSKRSSIALRDAILPWIDFQQPEFTRILNWLKGQTITETKGVFDNITANINGFTFVFGLGGIHGSVENETVEANSECVIESIDVSSMYPNLAIVNGFHPAHLGKTFCSIYKDLYEQRKSYPKDSAENAMLKLALNGTYGDSNNKFSVFYDPLFTMKITLSGQLMLCMLADKLMSVPTLRVIMANTDGLEYTIHPDHVQQAVDVCSKWEVLTQLTLERARYKRMFILNVNNYIAEYEE